MARPSSDRRRRWLAGLLAGAIALACDPRAAAPAADATLRGTALDLMGEPLAERTLYACALERCPADLKWLPNLGLSNLGARMWRRWEESSSTSGAKRERGWASTDSDGHFEIGGLARREYRVFVIPELNHLCPYELTSAPLRPDEPEQRLSPQGQFLLLRLTDRDGLAWPTAALGDGYVSSRQLGIRSVAAASSPSASGAAEFAPPCEVRVGELLIPVEGGQEYRLPPTRAGVEGRRLRIEPGRPLTVLALRFETPASEGDLRLLLTDPDGRPYRRDAQVSIRDEAGEWVSRADRFATGPISRRSLAPGRYRISASAEEIGLPCGSSWTPELARYGPVEGSCEIRLGQECRMQLALRAGGRIELIAHLPADLGPEVGAELRIEALEELVRHPDESRSCTDTWNLLERGDAGPSVAGHALPLEGGESLPLRFHVPTCSLTHTSTRLLPGFRTLTDTLLPPGNYLVQLESARFTSEPTAVRVRDGETSPLTLALTWRGPR